MRKPRPAPDLAAVVDKARAGYYDGEAVTGNKFLAETLLDTLRENA